MENVSDKNLRLRTKARRLPLLPGVYIMRDKNGKIIYIGKAKQLKNRVSQYFGAGSNHTDKVRRMVEMIEDFEYIICQSEYEALVLECSLIKQHLPKYNILLKDDKGYHYIKVTKGEWPTISPSFDTDDSAEYLGPYTSGWLVKQTIDEARKIFKLPQCQKQFPRDIKSSRPCLNFYIGCCSAPCAAKIKAEEYRDSVSEAVQFIKGGAMPKVAELKKKMEQAAENLEFEKAARIRDRITAIEKIKQRQNVVMSTYEVQDVIASASSGEKVCFEVFRFKNSRLYDREQFIVDRTENADILTAEFLRRYYSMRNDIPPRVAVNTDFEDREVLEEWLTAKSGKRVNISVPKVGDQRKLVEMCEKNAGEFLAEQLGFLGREVSALDEIAKLLGLKQPPRIIEAYDISNTAGHENVAGMTVFKNGKPSKKDYRLFKIKGFSGQDDYRSLAEVIERRFDEYYKLKDLNEGFGRLPDLILIDGGVGQINAVIPILKNMNIDVPVFGMVKDSKHHTSAIASTGGKIAIKSNRAAFTLITAIQDETHRFAIGYHHKRAKKSGLESEILKIPGIGKTRAQILFKHFKTLKALKDATVDELRSVSGMNLPSAEAVYNYFNKDGYSK